MIYLLNTEKDDNGTLLVTSEAFPEVTTFSEDRAHVSRNGLAAVEEAIAARMSDGEDIPNPASPMQIARHKGVWVKLPLMTALKVQLYNALREADVTRAELARRMKKPRTQVDRLFHLDHQSKTDQIEQAFHALHKDVDIRIGQER